MEIVKVEGKTAYIKRLDKHHLDKKTNPVALGPRATYTD
jgi:hypothetical protein